MIPSINMSNSLFNKFACLPWDPSNQLSNYYKILVQTLLLVLFAFLNLIFWIYILNKWHKYQMVLGHKTRNYMWDHPDTFSDKTWDCLLVVQIRRWLVPQDHVHKRVYLFQKNIVSL